MRCSFCWEDTGNKQVVTNGTICICSSCLIIANEIIKESKKQEDKRIRKND